MEYEIFKAFKESDLEGNELKTIIQENEIDVWLRDFKGIGYLSNFTGSGKTRIGCRVIERFFAKFDGRICILVPSKLIQEQWEERLGDLANRVEVYIINSYTSLKKQMNRTWDILIADELHKICNDKSKYFSKAISISKFSKFLGLTATLDDDKKKFLARFGIKEAFEFTLQEGYALGLVPDSNIYNISSTLNIYEEEQYDDYQKTYNQTLQYFAGVPNIEGKSVYDLVFACRMTHDKKTKQPIFSSINIGGQYQYNSNQNWINRVAKYYNISSKEVVTKSNVWFSAMTGRNSILDNSENKLLQARDLIESNSNRKTIIFTDSVSTADFLANSIEGLQSIHSKLNKKKRKELTNSFRNQEYNQIVTVKAMDEGADYPFLEFGLNNYYTSSEITFAQRYGRILRFDESNTNKLVNFVNQITRSSKDKDKVFQDEVQLKRAQKSFNSIKQIELIEQINWNK